VVDRDAREPGDARGVPEHREVEPADSAGAPGDGAEFAALLTDVVSERFLVGVAVEFSRERSLADSREVRLHDADDFAVADRGDAEPEPTDAAPAVGFEEVTNG